MGKKFLVICPVCKKRKMLLSPSEFIRRRTCSNKCKAEYLSKKPLIVRKLQESHQKIMVFNPLVGWFLYGLFLFLVIFIPTNYVIQSGHVIEVQNAKAEEVEVPDLLGMNTEQLIKYYADIYGKKYNVSPYQMKRTAWCETHYQNKQSEVVKNGKRENSWGVMQIHLDSHPEVSKKQALNIEFAMEWSAKHWHSVRWFGYNRKTDSCN